MFFILFTLFLGLNARVVNRNSLPIENHLPSDIRPCSMNASSAYVDIILLIDTSANMGLANLKKISTTISLVLTKFTIGNQVDITKGYRNTRVAVIAYDAQAKILANYTDINNVNDLSNILNGLTPASSRESNLYDGFMKAFYLQTNCTDPNNCSIIYSYERPTAMIVLAASANSNENAMLFNMSMGNYFDGSLISVNFNSTDQNLNALLMNLTWNDYLNASMYNLSGKSTTLAKDLEWAILQANCYCGDVGGFTTVYYDKVNARYQRYAECIYLETYGDRIWPNNTLEMCSFLNLQIIPSFILSEEKQTFIQTIWPYYPNNLLNHDYYPYYFGLHQNSMGQWVFYNYDLSEFHMSNFSNWAMGYPNGTSGGGCAITDSDDKGATYRWKSTGCDINANGVIAILCSARACDATSTDCCINCIKNGHGQQRLESSNFHQRTSKSKNRHNKHIFKYEK